MKVEIVVRDYLAGNTSTSLLSMYNGGRREMYGRRSRRHARQSEADEMRTIITRTTKAFGGRTAHDEELTAERISPAA